MYLMAKMKYALTLADVINKQTESENSCTNGLHNRLYTLSMKGRRAAVQTCRKLFEIVGVAVVHWQL